MTRNYRALIVAMAIALGSGSPLTTAQTFTGQPQSLSTTASYSFLIGSGFLCEASDTSMCPAKVRGSSRESYEMTGAGTFDAQSKAVKAAGAYTHKSPNGNILETGVWIASELVAFDSYGSAPGAVLRQGLAAGPARFGSKGFGLLSGPMPTGGLAIFRVRLLPMQGPPRIAVLQVNSVLGDVPRERSVEGIRLTFERTDAEFSEEASGRVMFLSMRPEFKLFGTKQQETAPETSGAPSN
jgi:hypothetical protein